MKSFLLGFALLSVMFITACGCNKKNAETSETVTTEVVEQVSEEVATDSVVVTEVATEVTETEVK